MDLVAVEKNKQLNVAPWQANAQMLTRIECVVRRSDGTIFSSFGRPQVLLIKCLGLAIADFKHEFCHLSWPLSDVQLAGGITYTPLTALQVLT